MEAYEHVSPRACDWSRVCAHGGYASEELLADREFVLAAVKRDGHALGYASEELCADREVVLAAVTQDGNAIQHASEELGADCVCEDVQVASWSQTDAR
jgi:hypothetical protein